MRLVYSITGYLTQVVFHLLALFHPKVRQIVAGRRQTAERLQRAIVAGRPVFWLHASSLGEFEQGRPLIEWVRAHKPDYQIVVSFFSPSGYNVRHSYAGADAVVYLPVDTTKSVQEFLRYAHPDVAVFVKYDFWPTMLAELSARGIPTYLVSGIFRKDQLFFRSYGGWYRDLLHQFTHLFVQDPNSLQLLWSRGINHVSISGDTRFDRVIDIAQGAKSIPEAERLRQGGKPVLVVGSSWPEDEAHIIRYFNAHPDLRLILAPHEIGADRLRAITAQLTRPWAYYTEVVNKSEVPDYDCLVVDCIGLLSSLYRYADISYIGGGFGKGIHNILEAAVYGMPLLFGANNQRFKEAQDLLTLEAAIEVTDAESFALAMDSLLADSPRRERLGAIARSYVYEHQGATEIITREIFGD